MKKELEEVLKKAGWYEGRNIDIEEDIREMECEGLVFNEKAREFLREYGNLKITVESEFLNERNTHIHNTELLEMKKFMHGKSGYWYLECGDKEQKKEMELSPIILVDSGRYVIYMSKDGKCYWENYYFAENIEEAFNRVLTLHLEEQEIIIEVLKKAGWYEGRNIDITPCVKCMEEGRLENPVNEYAQKFLKEFGELDINIETYSKGEKRIRNHNTYSSELAMCNQIELNYIDYYRELEATPIIIGNNYNYAIFMSNKGMYYWERGIWANNIEELWRELLSATIRDKERIYCQLKEAGWHKGRKIDISDSIVQLMNNGFNINNKAKEFLEVYGEMLIDKKYIHFGKRYNTKYSLYTRDIIDCMYSNKVEKFPYKQNSTPVILVKKEDKEFLIYISETGEFYAEDKLFAENIELLWHRCVHDYSYID